MKNKLPLITLLFAVLCAFTDAGIVTKLTKTVTVDSVGASQGISYQKGRIFLYGDREVGMLREYRLMNDSLVDLHREVKFTQNGRDVINHPTGIAYNGSSPTFIGNSIRLNKEGTKWRAVIYCVDWNALLKTGTLDGTLLNTIDDDACIQGTRPEYVKYNGKWYVATADYGDHGNEVRLYDPEKLKTAKKTSDPGVLYKKFTCTPWVQNLHWVADRGILVLVQNKMQGRQWRFTYINLEKSIATGSQVVVQVTDGIDRADELEGFAFTGSRNKGIAVTSARKNNVNFTATDW
ncbi:hypothetical protein A0256_04565 [Mucilaginibacter sp. PAMC 26640]|nr:hypothetical protein A0256_04565 [Mucilaginibacter sp. PAMC 26640]